MGHEVIMKGVRNAQKICSERSEWRSLTRLGHRMVHAIKTDLREVWCGMCGLGSLG